MTQDPDNIRQPEAKLARDQSGIASVEFAMITAVLLVLLAGALDVYHMVTSRRDAERIAVEVVQTLAACSSSPCVLQAGMTLAANQKNAFLTSVAPTISWSYVSRVNDKILVSFGNMTYLPADVESAAKVALPGNNDNGVCSIVTTRIDSIGLITTLFSAETRNPRYFICSIQSKNVKVI